MKKTHSMLRRERSESAVRCGSSFRAAGWPQLLVLFALALGSVACASQDPTPVALEHVWSGSVNGQSVDRLRQAGAGDVIQLRQSRDPITGIEQSQVVWHRAAEGASTSVELGNCPAADAAAVGERLFVLFSSGWSIPCGEVPATSFTPEPDGSVAVAEFDGDGTLVWGRNYPVAAPFFRASQIGIDASGTVSIVARKSFGPLTVGSTSLDGDENTSSALLTLAAGGEVKRVQAFWPGVDTMGAFAVDPATGDRFLAGSFAGVVDVGTGALAAGEGVAMLLLRLDADGEPIWAKHFMGSAAFTARFSEDGDLILKGYGDGATGFFLGGDKVINGAFVTRLKGDGTHVETYQLATTPDTEHTHGMVRAGAMDRSSEGRIVALQMEVEFLDGPVLDNSYGNFRVRFTLRMGFVDSSGGLAQERVVGTWEDTYNGYGYSPPPIQVVADGASGFYAVTCGHERLDFGGEPLLASPDDPEVCAVAHLRVR